MSDTRTCTGCWETKPQEGFSKDRSARSGFSSQCKTCRTVAMRKWHKRNPDYSRAWWYKKHYDITIDDYHQMLVAQRGLCAICRKPPGSRRLNLDHDHKSGKVRGLLCLMCNRGLGRFRDDPELFRSAADYLERGNAGE